MTVITDKEAEPAVQQLNEEEQLRLQEIEETRLSLLMLQQYVFLQLNKLWPLFLEYNTYRKRNELENMKNMLALAMEK